VSLQVGACTHTGALRANNEDAFRYCLARGVFVVCDGMGGAAAGEIASHMAADSVIEMLCGERQVTGWEAVEAAIVEANRRIYVRSQRDPSLFGMGTTLVLLRVEDGRACLAHVGDSRCYLLRQGTLWRCTQDHSLVDEQLRMGTITPAEAENSPYRNVITRALGTQPTVAPDHNEMALDPEDLLLLCTDGLTRELTDTQIAALLQAGLPGGNLAQMCQELVDAANAAGGHDNITCMAIQV
jgi:PPM family protein phosphatase